MEVIFDVKKFRSVYVGFQDENRVTDEALKYCFEIACSIVGNGDNSLVPYNPEATPPVKTREAVLMMVTCHLATINYLWEDTQVGAVASANQGTVSASFSNPQSPEWWSQTKCGMQALYMLRRFNIGVRYFGVTTVYTGG